MGFQLSPGVNVSEIDLTGFIPAVSTSGAAYVGQFEWGPVLDYTTLENKKLLQKWFGKPNDTNYRDWYTCSNYLDYSNNLNIVRVVDEAVALNADVSGTGILIKNETHYNQVYGTPTGDASILASKYPGEKGDSIRIMLIDSNTYDQVKVDYGDVLPNQPETSEYVKNLGGENDELHMLIFDSKGLFTGVPNALLEVYTFVSKASDGKDLDGKPIFYGTVLNVESEYVWFLEIPDSADMAVGGSIQSATITESGNGYLTAPVVTITGVGMDATAHSVLAERGEVWDSVIVDDGGAYNTAPLVTFDGDGSGAQGVAQLDTLGTVADITVDIGGSYSVAPLVTIGGDGSGATADAVLATAGNVASIGVDIGGEYLTPPTVVVGGDGSGATATAVLSTTGGLSSVTVTNGGTGYAVGDTIIIVGDGTLATAEVGTETGGVIDTITVTNPGSGYTFVTIDAENGTGTGTGGVATGEVSFAVASVTVDTAGSGYTTAPVSFTGGSEIVLATATSVIEFAVSVINVTAGGSGYTTAPVTFDSGSATATSLLAYPVINVDVTQGGVGYTSATVVFDTGTAMATATIAYGVGEIVIDVAGADYEDGNTFITMPLELGTRATADPVVTPGADYDARWNTPAINSKYTSLSVAWDKKFSGGVDSLSIDENELINGWSMFRNAEIVDVSLLILGDAGEDVGPNSHTTVIKYVVENVAEWRKDCVAFFSPRYADVVNQPETLATENCVDRRNTINVSSSYAFMDSGWKYQYDVFNDKYRWIPLNADMAGVCAQTDLIRDPWWSPAGFARGQIKNVIKLALNPNKGNRDELYQSNVNPVVSFVGEGVLLYGDRTQLARPSLFQKLNIRRLFIVLEKAIAKAAKYQLFEFNDAFTRAQFVSQVEPYLREVQGRRGINDFRVVCDESNNTGEVIDRSEFVGDIYIKPNNSINFIQLNFVAVRNGVEFDEVVGKF